MSTDNDIIELEDRGVITLSGSETLNFLQDLVTADVTLASESRAAYGLLLTPQGKFLYDFFILRDGDVWLLECERARADELVKRLSMYRLRKKIEIENVSDGHRIVAMPSGGVPDAAKYSYTDPRHNGLGTRAIIAAGSGLAFAPAEEYEQHRIALGIPSAGPDLEHGVSFPLDCNLDELNAIDFDKGCYVGQEVTARSKHRGNIRKRILPVHFSQASVQPGSEVLSGDRNGGQVLSVQGDQGLAMIRLERWKSGAPLKCGDVDVTPRIPDWLHLDTA